MNVNRLVEYATVVVLRNISLPKIIINKSLPLQAYFVLLRQQCWDREVASAVPSTAGGGSDRLARPVLLPVHNQLRILSTMKALLVSVLCLRLTLVSILVSLQPRLPLETLLVLV